MEVTQKSNKQFIYLHTYQFGFRETGTDFYSLTLQPNYTAKNSNPKLYTWIHFIVCLRKIKGIILYDDPS